METWNSSEWELIMGLNSGTNCFILRLGNSDVQQKACAIL